VQEEKIFKNIKMLRLSGLINNNNYCQYVGILQLYATRPQLSV
jgi:hypothetical protein